MQQISSNDIRSAREQLGDLVETTPVRQLVNERLAQIVGSDTTITLKLELFQRAGSFKARGALLNILRLEKAALQRGVTAISAGNHAVAVAYAAHTLGVPARLVIIKTANPLRVQLCRDYGAEIEFAEDSHSGFARVRELEEAGYAFVHPYDGIATITGTATVGFELAEQVAPLDAVIVAIGGGGLCAGISTALKALWPSCAVFGVEPVGADAMRRSFDAGKVVPIERVATIADSLGAPYPTEMTLATCRENLEGLVLVSDEELRDAMRMMFYECKLVVEPAGAAAMAALLGPLRERLRGRSVGLIVCGANIDVETYARLLATG